MKLVAIEGIDGSGKTTLARSLKSSLESKVRVEITSEPFNEGVIRMIESSGWEDPVYLTLLFAADRALHLKWIHSLNVDLVITDRYLFSSMAYQTAMGVDLEWIKAVNSKFPMPDLTILLDIPLSVARSRIRQDDRFRFRKKEAILQRAREIYMELSRSYNFKVIDATKPSEEVLREAIDAVSPLL
jgi:dTMP kinase